jgi:5-formyltetrahydrofolate cyclo-ligase
MKADLRQLLLTKRLAMTAAEVATASFSLIKQIRQLNAYQKAKVIGLYMPIKNEPDLTSLSEDGKKVLLPKVTNLDLIYVAWQPGQPLIRSELGILEPEGNKDKSDLLDLLIIPAIALDQQGNRLGFGKGFFDRFLMHQRPKLVIGVIYPFQRQEKLMTSKLDMPVDLVLIA